MSPCKILFALSGSIACFKACGVISDLVQQGHEVQPIATRNALKFIGPATLEGLTGRTLLSEVFDRKANIDHIQLTRWADLFVICPATGNLINKMAQGIADDLVTNLVLAYDYSKPLLIAPAMNHSMLAHPATQHSLKVLSGWGAQILDTDYGMQACQEEGLGRLLDPAKIIECIQNCVSHFPISPRQT
jgi:phosphopantothenoylcysteine decarboxylase/phosphopantothenate--cysteine ligase